MTDHRCRCRCLIIIDYHQPILISFQSIIRFITKKHVITIIISTTTTISITFTLKKVYPVIPPAQGLNQRQINRVSFTIINIAVIVIVTIDVLIKFVTPKNHCHCHCHCHCHKYHCYSLTRKSMISMHPLGLTRCTDNIYDFRNIAYNLKIIVLRGKNFIPHIPLFKPITR